MRFKGLFCVAFAAVLLTFAGCREDEATTTLPEQQAVIQTTVIDNNLATTTLNSSENSTEATIINTTTASQSSTETTATTAKPTTKKTTSATAESTTEKTTPKTTTSTTKKTTTKTTKLTTKKTTKKTTTKTTKPTTKKTTKKTTAKTTKSTTKTTTKVTTTKNKTTAKTTKPTTKPTTTKPITTTTRPTTKTTTTKATTTTTTKKITTTTKAQSPTTTKHIINTNKVAWYLLLANGDNQLPADYKVKDVIIKGGQYPGYYRYSLDERIVDIWNKMYDDAMEDGVLLTALSTYRSVADQNTLFKNKKKEYLNKGYSDSEAETLAAKSVMYPGCSDHNLGLAVDIGSLEEKWENSDGFKWLTEHAEDYGFVLRYPKNKVAITKVKYEPWHWRYVGIEAAKEMNRFGMCLEEYHIYKGFVQ